MMTRDTPTSRPMMIEVYVRFQSNIEHEDYSGVRRLESIPIVGLLLWPSGVARPFFRAILVR